MLGGNVLGNLQRPQLCMTCRALMTSSSMLTTPTSDTCGVERHTRLHAPGAVTRIICHVKQFCSRCNPASRQAGTGMYKLHAPLCAAHLQAEHPVILVPEPLRHGEVSKVHVVRS